jgi:cell division protein FtsA
MLTGRQNSGAVVPMKNGLIAALDVGTTKVCCFIGRVVGENKVRVTGIGHQVSRGLRNGAVADMDAVETSVRTAVDAAERMAGETIKNVLVNLSCGDPASHTVGIDVPVNGSEIDDRDLRRVLDQGMARAEPGEREVIHAIPVAYTVDGASGIKDPRGMFGARLGVNMHIVTASSSPLRNLHSCIDRGHLGIDSTVVSSYASGLATLVEDEKDLGVTLIEMGGGTTSVAVFYDGCLVFADVVPLGGQHVTNDIARGLATPTGHAERMKTLYGSAIATPADDRELIDVPQVGESDQAEPNHVPRSALSGIIQPRVEETLELVRDRLAQSGYDRIAGRRVVLSGGACQLQGVRELAARVLDKQVRVGRPIRIQGLAESTAGPAFSTCAGLLCYGANGLSEALRADANDDADARGLRRLGRWLKENF